MSFIKKLIKRLFGTKTTISVASTVYNMSGEYDNNNKYFKAIVFSGILKKISVSDTIIGNLFSCPKAKYNKFFNYAQKSNFSGKLITNINNRKKIDVNIIIDYLNAPVGTYVNIEKAFIDYGDITYWANKHILLNYPTLALTDWVAEITGLNQITITYEDSSTEVISIPDDYKYSNEYLIAYIKYYNESFNDPEEEGGIIDVNYEDLPNTSEYINISNDTTDNSESLTKTTTVLREYSDSTPTTTIVTSTSSTNVFTSYVKIKEKTTYLGIISGETIQSLKETYKEFLNYNIIESTEVNVEVIDHGLYTETITTTIVTELFEAVYSYQFNTQITTLSSLINEDMLIYKLGSGITILDSLNSTSTNIVEDLYPIIPLRVNNGPINLIPFWYNQCKKAYSIVMDNKFDKLLDTIANNPSIADIDYCYIHFGFSLNTESNDEKLYIYEFFKNLINYQESTRQEYLSWLNQIYTDQQFIDDYTEWFIAQYFSSDPLFGTTAPLLNGSLGSKVVMPAECTLLLKTNTIGFDNFDVRITWSNIQEDIYNGLGKTGAKKGDIWFSIDPPSQNLDFVALHESSIKIFSEIVRLGLFEYDPLNSLKDTHVYLYQQIENNSYRVLSIAGLSHRNYIYQNAYNVGISAREALGETEPSGFIIPLSQYVLNQLSWVAGNEICMRAGNLVFNTYQFRKRLWYARAAFKIFIINIFIVIIIVVTIVTAGTATGPVAAAAAAAVTAVGIAGTAAIIATALLTLALNMIIGMLITFILTKALTPLIGEKYARLVATIATVVIMAGINTSFDATMMSDLLLRADNIILLSLSVVDFAIQETTNIQGLASDVTYIQNKNEAQNKLIKENNELLGLNKADDLINKVIKQLILHETPQDFLSRSLISSNDVIEMSMGAVSSISSFTDIIL